MANNNDNIQGAAFDYESSTNQDKTQTASKNIMSQENSGTQNLSPSTSYSSVAKSVPKPVFPKKDQAIVLHAEENLKLFDYVKAIGDIIGAKNIIFASRISNNRICIYLSKTELVDLIVNSHSIISIGNKSFNIRRLISPTKRILISNISPCIPHDLAEIALKNLGLNLASPISFLKAGIPGDEYSHILSFRRQVFVFLPYDNLELQTSTTIHFDNNDHRIFLSTDRMECFICKETGHIAINCPNPPTHNSSQTITENENQQLPPCQIDTSTKVNDQENKLPILQTALKRVHSDTTPTDNDVSGDVSPVILSESSIMPPPNNTTDAIKPSRSARKKVRKKLLKNQNLNRI